VRRAPALALLIAFVAYLLVPAAAGASTPSWEFEPATFSFGAVAPGQAAPAPARLELLNTGEVRLFPTLVALTPSDDFKLASNECHDWLEPGDSCAIEVTFRPRSSGTKEAALEVAAWEETAPPTAAHLSGTGAAPTVTIDPATVDFGTIPAGNGPRAQRSATITNQGPGDLSFSGLEFLIGGAPATLPGPLNWSGSTCQYGSALPPGASCTVTFSLGSSDTVSAAGELRIADNALDSPQVIHVSGTVWATPPVIPGPPPPFTPLATLSGHPGKRTRSRAATFTFSGNEDTRRFECRLDDGPFRRCASPARYRALKPGKHRFRVRPIGVRGFTVLGPAVSYEWRVVRVRRP
jgi:hypothetical protein